ncbi:MAG TPA: hypothetical protein GX404_09405 [Syntrophomonadaceae bacterium]|nr:hypothetical protein [Syntrophomonadaceae bacterium]
MKENVIELIQERDHFDVDVYQKTPDNKTKITRYLELEVDVKNDDLFIQGIGSFSLDKDKIMVDDLGMIVIDAPHDGVEKIIII